MVKVGVVGFSGTPFDEAHARQALREILSLFQGQQEVEIVSGWSNIGIPRIAYEEAEKLGIGRLVGLAPRAVRAQPCGLYSVHKEMLVGETFGDESQTLVDYCDVMVRVGGGPQAFREVAMFRERLTREAGADVATNRIHEIDMSALQP
jgi:hypothetical protein